MPKTEEFFILESFRGDRIYIYKGIRTNKYFLIISSISILIDGARIDHSILGNVVILDK